MVGLSLHQVASLIFDIMLIVTKLQYGNLPIYCSSTNFSSGDEFVGPFVDSLKEEVPEARVTIEISEEGSKITTRWS